MEATEAERPVRAISKSADDAEMNWALTIGVKEKDRGNRGMRWWRERRTAAGWGLLRKEVLAIPRMFGLSSVQAIALGNEDAGELKNSLIDQNAFNSFNQNIQISDHKYFIKYISTISLHTTFEIIKKK